ncbi:MAG: NAD(P)-binding domain-containing protein [Specibacter sp.]
MNTITGTGNMARGIAARALTADRNVEVLNRDPDKAAAVAAELGTTVFPALSLPALSLPALGAGPPPARWLPAKRTARFFDGFTAGDMRRRQLPWPTAECAPS